jgi:hypothetical protein
LFAGQSVFVQTGLKLTVPTSAQNGDDGISGSAKIIFQRLSP